MNHQSMVKELQEILPEIPKLDLPVLLGELERLKALTWHRMMSETYTPQSGAAQTLLTMKDVASELNIPLSCAYDLRARKTSVRPRGGQREVCPCSSGRPGDYKSSDIGIWESTGKIWPASAREDKIYCGLARWLRSPSLENLCAKKGSEAFQRPGRP